MTHPTPEFSVTSTAPKDETPQGRGHSLQRIVKALYPTLSDEHGGLNTILRKQVADLQGSSKQPLCTGTKQHPIDFSLANLFRTVNIHHGVCINAKTQATVGLGFVSPEVEKKLNALCSISLQSTISQVLDDHFNLGNGYLEVVRGEGGAIKGLHFMPAGDVHKYLENDLYQFHYQIRGGAVGSAASVNPAINSGTVMAAFGDLENFRERHNIPEGRRISELIHLPEVSSLDRWYGVPSWIPAVAAIELTQAVNQHQMDFHVNRGVPEFIAWILGTQLQPKLWKEITGAFQDYVGVGNSHKSSVFNIPGEENIKVQVDKLAMDGAANGTFFRDQMEVLSVSIVSAHRVPPSLAGILIPGKMGAANETTNAIMGFQSLVIGPAQHLVEVVFGNTLGNAAVNGGLGLSPESFKLRTIVEEMAEAMKALAPADTMGRMKSELPEAAAEGRDLNEGLKKAEETIVEKIRSLLGQRG